MELPLFQGIAKLSGNDYPKDIGKYEVTAELDAGIPSDTAIYTVTTVKATLEIKPMQGNITFGPDIFYYDGNPTQVTLAVGFQSLRPGFYVSEEGE